MKKYLSIFVAVLLVVGVAFSASAGLSGPGTGDILGQGKYQSDAHKIFRMVRYVPATYAGATTLAADSIVIWDLGEDDGVTVSTSTTSYDSAVAGIIVVSVVTPDTDGNTAAQDRGKANWTWLQTYGLSQVNLSAASSTIAAGAALATSTTAGEASPFVASASVTGANGNAGFFYDAASPGDDDVECFLSLD